MCGGFAEVDFRWHLFDNTLLPLLSLPGIAHRHPAGRIRLEPATGVVQAPLLGPHSAREALSALCQPARALANGILHHGRVRGSVARALRTLLGI